MPRTLFEKIWDSHVVHHEPGEPAILYIDCHLVHEVTSPQAFEGLRLSGRKVRRPDLTFATVDHNVPTWSRSLPITDPISKAQIDTLEWNCREFGALAFGIGTSEVEHVLATQCLLQSRPATFKIQLDGALSSGVTAKDCIL